MQKINTDFVLSNKSKWRDAVKIQPVIIEKLHIEKFKGRSKLVIQTIEGAFEIRKEEYIRKMEDNPDNTLYIVYNVNIELGKVSKRYKNQNRTGVRVLDRLVVKYGELKRLGYEKYKYGTYKKLTKKVKYFIAEEDLCVKVSWSGNLLKGKKGDVVVIYGKDEYNIIDRELFESTYEPVRN